MGSALFDLWVQRMALRLGARSTRGGAVGLRGILDAFECLPPGKDLGRSGFQPQRGKSSPGLFAL